MTTTSNDTLRPASQTPAGTVSRVLRFVRFAALLSSIAGCAASSRSLREFETSHVYYPHKYPIGDWQPASIASEDAWFTAADGTRLHGWYVPCPDPRAVVLFAHGHAGNVTNQAPILRALRQRHQVSILTFDYRGYGRSEGSPDEAGLLQDARAARTWLARRAGVAEGDIVLMGQSLGGGVVVDLAAHDGARGLILQNTFATLPDVARHHFRCLPASWLMTNRFDSLAKIGEYRGPLLQSHGDKDRTIPYAHALRLFEAANEPKWFVAIQGGDHNDWESEGYHLVLGQFIAALPLAPGPTR